MKIASPLWLLGLIAVAIIVWRLYHRKPGTFYYSNLDIFLKLRERRRWLTRRGLLVIRIIALVLLVAAMARPQSGVTREEFMTRGIDIMLTLDVSGSMRAEDFKPDNRLYAAKETIEDFINARKNDQIGLVVFATDSFTQCPLTLDYPVLTSLLEEVDIGIIDENSTAIGMALATAINRLRDSDAKSRIIILLTDGESNAGSISPQTAAELAKNLGIRVYTIGAGIDGMTTIPVNTAMGTMRRRVRSKIDEETLRDIAQATGGKFYRAKSAEALKKIYEDIDRLEKTEIKVHYYTRYKELFVYPLVIALALLLLESVLNLTRLRRIH